jgi:plasmid stabilization system protein ParE
MSYRLEISSDARQQLVDIANWYRERSGSVEVAASWHDGFLVALQSLCDNPESCPLAQESDAFSFELRELHYGSGRAPTHRALFRIQGDMVEVLAIRHFAQRAITPDDLT